MRGPATCHLANAPVRDFPARWIKNKAHRESLRMDELRTQAAARRSRVRGARDNRDRLLRPFRYPRATPAGTRPWSSALASFSIRSAAALKAAAIAFSVALERSDAIILASCSAARS